MHTVRRAATIAIAVAVLVSFVPTVSHADPHRGRCGDSAVRCWIRKYWGADDEEALSVARCESGYDPHAQTGSHYGIFQLAEGYHRERAERMGYTWDDMWDAGKNTRVAFSLYSDEGWQPWTCKP